ncbi:hypothetical protein SAMN05421796_101168 [Chryseobacterium piscicola]|uniref:DUF4440 domain-containing protein n=2 Tax=Chryseobacterium piscicola TaxID=551459 RepID=A0A1N7JVR0_9FLAO|nr:hypothetical protein B0A70_12300 [Chryseobacterium piscicola]SIS53413.1 hypothetical protein SAMN05421796_101168 [Chryseobacterium piscicola]
MFQFENLKMRFFCGIFLLFFVFGYSQKYSKSEEAVLIQAKKLDSLMKNNDISIVNLFSTDVSFGHSNSWIQNLDDFKKDFSSKKVIYKEIKQTEVSEIKNFKNTISLRRTIKVEGLYKNQDFEMKLAVLEIWVKKKSVWKLWSRQSVEIKP